MPIITPYPTVESVLNVARTAMADAGVDSVSGLIVGDVFTDDRPSTLITLQSAYDYVQAELANNGAETFAKTAIIAGLPPVATTDPGIEVELSFTGYFDGVNNNGAPVLPGDLRRPLWMQERMAGSQNIFGPDPPMGPCNDGLPQRAKTTYSPEWEWSTDRIRMVGALLALDKKLRYIPYLPKLGIANQNILILGAENAVGYAAAAMFSSSVGGEGAANLLTAAKEFITQICIQTTRGQQRGNHRRQPYSLRRRMGLGRR